MASVLAVSKRTALCSPHSKLASTHFSSFLVMSSVIALNNLCNIVDKGDASAVLNLVLDYPVDVGHVNCEEDW